jgi:hypothetical protein
MLAVIAGYRTNAVFDSRRGVLTNNGLYLDNRLGDHGRSAGGV